MIQPKTECRLEVRLIHNTSRAYRLFCGGLLDLTAELISHGREQFIRVVCLSTEGNPHASLVEDSTYFPTTVLSFLLANASLPGKASPSSKRRNDIKLKTIALRKGLHLERTAA